MDLNAANRVNWLLTNLHSRLKYRAPLALLSVDQCKALKPRVKMLSDKNARLFQPYLHILIIGFMSDLLALRACLPGAPQGYAKEQDDGSHAWGCWADKLLLEEWASCPKADRRGT